MDYSNLAHKIIAQTVAVMQELLASYYVDVEKEKDKKAIIHLLKIVKEFLYIQDVKKAANYKIAILVEFLETMTVIIQDNISPIYTHLHADIDLMFEYIEQIKNNTPAQEELSSSISERLDHFYDFDRIDPELVVFWLNTTCTFEELRSMQAFVLFVPKSLHTKIFERDVSLREDRNVALLLECATI